MFKTTGKKTTEKEIQDKKNSLKAVVADTPKLVEKKKVRVMTLKEYYEERYGEDYKTGKKINASDVTCADCALHYELPNPINTKEFTNHCDYWQREIHDMDDAIDCQSFYDLRSTRN